MPVWPFLIAITVGLTLWGWRHGVWIIPALAFAGYLGMRGVIWGLPSQWHEVAGCTLWLCVAAAMMYFKGWVPGFFYALSGLTYPVMLLFGFRIEYLGLSPIIAEVFALLALLSIGGGIAGYARHNHAGGYPDRPVSWVASFAVGMASR